MATNIVDDFSQLVVGVDDTDASYDAVAFAGSIARRHNATITLVFVETQAAVSGLSPAAGQGIRDSWDAIGENIQRFAHEHLDPESVSWKYVRRSGEAADEIGHVAREEKADAIVVGRAAHRVVHGPLGSVPVRLAHTAPCPLIIVP